MCCNCVQSPLFLLSWLVTARSYQRNIASRGNLRRACAYVCALDFYRAYTVSLRSHVEISVIVTYAIPDNFMRVQRFSRLDIFFYLSSVAICYSPPFSPPPPLLILISLVEITLLTYILEDSTTTNYDELP